MNVEIQSNTLDEILIVLKDIRRILKTDHNVSDNDVDVLSLREAAAFCNFSEPGMRRLVSQKIVPFYKPKGTKDYKFIKNELIEWLKGKEGGEV